MRESKDKSPAVSPITPSVVSGWPQPASTSSLFGSLHPFFPTLTLNPPLLYSLPLLFYSSPLLLFFLLSLSTSMASSLPSPQPLHHLPQLPLDAASSDPHPISGDSPPPQPDSQLHLIDTATASASASASMTVTVSSISTPITPHPEPPMGVPILVAAQPPSSSRRLPPPCWTPDETSVLIDAYRDKWYGLRRGNLRAAHWQEVADEIHSRCPDVLPPKTAVQCRHKMEKLRKRYRAELLRAKSIPHHRFSSSWLYFSKMDSMEKGGMPNVSLSSPVSTAMVVVPTPTPPPDVYEDDDGEDDDDDNNNDEDFSLRSYRQPRSGYYQQRNGLKIRIAGNNNTNSKQRSGGHDEYDDGSPNPSPNYGFNPNYSHNTTNPTFATPPPHYNGTSTARMVKNHHPNYGFNSGSGSGGMGMSYMNMSSSSGGGGGGGVINKKKRKMMNGMGRRDREDEREREREKSDEAALEMVNAIRMLGEGFVRMEKMKMEMMRETERMRMEMEMKRTEMLLDSQHRIVEAFAKGWNDVISSGNNTNNDQDNSNAS